MIHSKNFSLRAQALTKIFDKHCLFKDLNFSLETGESLAITGPNGSGKSTLLQILSLYQSPSQGKIFWQANKQNLPYEKITNFLGFSSPLVNPYDDLTALENIQLIIKKEKPQADLEKILEKFKLLKQKNLLIKKYSSGMKQRLKFILATINQPPFLFLDEPGTNLDQEGKKIIYSALEELKSKTILILATNEKTEKNICQEKIHLAD